MSAQTFHEVLDDKQAQIEALATILHNVAKLGGYRIDSVMQDDFDKIFYVWVEEVKDGKPTEKYKEILQFTDRHLALCLCDSLGLEQEFN